MTLYNLTSWAGKPSSGRSVYSGASGAWHWQCDMCETAYETDLPKWTNALSNALDHAYICPHVNAKNRSYLGKEVK